MVAPCEANYYFHVLKTADRCIFVILRRSIIFVSRTCCANSGVTSKLIYLLKRHIPAGQLSGGRKLGFGELKLVIVRLIAGHLWRSGRNVLIIVPRAGVPMLERFGVVISLRKVRWQIHMKEILLIFLYLNVPIRSENDNTKPIIYPII